MKSRIAKILLATAIAYVANAHGESAPPAPPEPIHDTFQLPAFYTQRQLAIGELPVVASEKASPFALKEAKYLIDQMLDGRDDIRKAMVDAHVHFVVMATTEMTTDIPEHSKLTPKKYWDRRARGLGATTHNPCVSCGEENLLCMAGDPYSKENILIHEFGHAIQEVGVAGIDKSFAKRLKKVFDHATEHGLFKDQYAGSNPHEYWAEGVQAWFNAGRPQAAGTDNKTNSGINTREKIKEYDPDLSALLVEVFGDKPWRYIRPDRRNDAGHLANLDRAKLPTFKWPAE